MAEKLPYYLCFVVGVKTGQLVQLDPMFFRDLISVAIAGLILSFVAFSFKENAKYGKKADEIGKVLFVGAIALIGLLTALGWNGSDKL